MRRTRLMLGATAVFVATVPANAQHYTRHTSCDRWHNGHCVAWHRMTCHEAREAGYRVGYNFGPTYSYVDLDALPQPVVTRYHLGPSFRYVNENGSVYVVNPHTYRVVRVIRVP